MSLWSMSERDKNMVLDALARYNLVVERLKEGRKVDSADLIGRVQTSTISDPTALSVVHAQETAERVWYVNFIEDIVDGFRPTEREFVILKYMGGINWPTDEWVRDKMHISKKKFREVKETALWDLKCELQSWRKRAS